MVKKKINFIDYLILYFLILIQIFFFHIYNSFEFNLIILIIFIFFMSSLYLSFKFITINLILNLRFEKKFILILLSIAFVFKFTILSNAYFNFDNNILNILSKGNFNLAIYFDLFLIFSLIFYTIILDIIKLNFNKIFYFSLLISTLLFLVSILVNLFSPSAEHIGWLNPFIYIYFYNDNVSSKLQHGYIYLLISIPIIHKMYQSKKIILKIFTVIIFFFNFLIFSKLFIVSLLLFIFGYNILYPNKNNIIVTIKLFLMSLTALAIFFFFTNSFFGKNVNAISELKLKFGKILYYSNIIDSSEIRSLSLKSRVDGLTNASIKKQLDYFDSSSSRFERFKFCTNAGLKYKIYNNFPVIKISSNYATGEFKSEFFQREYENYRYLIVNCEGSLIQIYYQYEQLSILFYFFLFLLFLYIYKKKDKFLLLTYTIIIIVSIQHLSFENPITYFFLAYLISKNPDNFKKIGSKTSLQN